jgi:hypothetical protein
MDSATALMTSHNTEGPHIDGGFPILVGPGGWLESALSPNAGNQSILDCLDAVAVHPYRGDGCDTTLPPVFCAPCDAAPGGCGPETTLADYQTLRGLIARYRPAGKAGRPVPLVVRCAFSAEI